MSGEVGVGPSRPVPLLLLTLVLLSTVGPATAQTPDLAGEYEADLTFSDVTPPCIDASLQGSLPSWDMEVQVRDTSNVDITFINLPSNGVDTVFNASLDPNLEVYGELDNWTIVGQFIGPGPDWYFNGRVQWTHECPIDSANTYRPVPQSIGVEANRVSGGEAQVPPPSQSTSSGTGFPGYALADQALTSDCDLGKEPLPENCRAALKYLREWQAAMVADRNRVPGDERSDVFKELETLMSIVSQAALLGGLLVDTPGGRVSRFPVVHGLLSVFAFLFVQGVSEAATGQIDSLRATVAQADDLLFAAVSAETRLGRS